MKELIEKIIPKLRFNFPYEIDDYSSNLYMENYHKHSMYSLIDSATSMEDYADKIKEYNYKCLFSGEHGWQGQYFYVYNLCEQIRKDKDNPYDLKFRYSTEAYWVKDRKKIVLEEYIDKKGETKTREKKDNTNCHIILVAKNYDGLEDINFALSIANEDGYYYKPRLDFELLLNINPNNVIVTSACIAGWKYEDAEECWLKLHKHFKDNFFLEVQNHNTENQKRLNKRILKLANQNNIQIIAGLDTHYISEEDKIKRENLLERKNFHYDDEDNWYMDFPNGKEVFKRFKEQNILSDEQILTAMMNTCVFINECEEIEFDRSFKIPNTYKELNYKERCDLLDKKLLNYYELEQFKSDEKLQAILYEANELKESNVIDYFLTNEKIIKTAIEEENGILTTTGRGSAPSFITNKLLGFTTIDRFTSDIPMYSERFLTKERVIESHQMPDIDFNVAEQEPFVSASKKIIGEHSCYPLIAFGQLKENNAWKLYAGINNIDPQTSNEISKAITEYNKALKYCETEEDKEAIDILEFIPSKYVDIYEKSKSYQGIIDGCKAHACFTEGTLVLTSNGYKNIEEINIGDYVLTHANKYEQVIKTMKNKTNEIISLKVTGDKIKTTPNHPFYVISKNGHKYIKKQPIRQYSQPYWKEAKLLNKDDYIGFAINQNNKLPKQVEYSFYNNPKMTSIEFNDSNFWWLIGRYIGDGWYETARRQTIICCSKKNGEFKDIVKKIPKHINYRIEEHRTSYKIITHNRDLYEFVQQFGKYAYGKFINNTIIDLPLSLLKEFLDGYLSADGCVESNGITFKTVSKKLAYGIQQCIHKVYKMPCTIRVLKPKEHTIEGRKVNCRMKYNGRFKVDECKSDVNFFKDGYIWIKIKDINCYKQECDTYNLGVANDNSYTVQNMIVHNCGHLLLEGDIRRKIGIKRCVSETTGKSILTTVIDGSVLDDFGYVKNDYLIVDSVALTNKIYRSIGKKVPSFDELRELIKNDEKTWGIYSKGLTCCINQCEKESTTKKVMTYKPKNIEELSAFIAGIRPGFKSLINNFINRQHYTTGEKNIDDLLKSSYHYMLYQESIMLVLNYLGQQMKDTYQVIKSISKKKLKGKKKDELNKVLNQNWIKIFNNDDNYNNIWIIINDSAFYAFNSPHAWSMAGDSLYLAYSKAHHTSKFYEEALNHYMDKNDKDKVASLLNEAKNGFGYNIGSFEYGKDNSKFTIDDSTKTIYPNLSSIKGIGDKVVITLLDFYNKGYMDIISIYSNLKNTPINKTVFANLIKIGYFKDFGSIKKLLYIVKLCDALYDKKSLSKDKLEDLGLALEQVLPYGNETEKQINKLDSFSLLNDLIKNIPDDEFSTIELIQMQKEVLGYVDYVNPKLDKKLCLVNTFDGKYNTKKISLYCLNNGKIVDFKLYDRIYKTKPIKDGDIIYTTSMKKEPKPILLGTDENGKKQWGKDMNNFEWILNDYNIIKEL